MRGCTPHLVENGSRRAISGSDEGASRSRSKGVRTCHWRKSTRLVWPEGSQARLMVGREKSARLAWPEESAACLVVCGGRRKSARLVWPEECPARFLVGRKKSARLVWPEESPAYLVVENGELPASPPKLVTCPREPSASTSREPVWLLLIENFQYLFQGSHSWRLFQGSHSWQHVLRGRPQSSHQCTPHAPRAP